MHAHGYVNSGTHGNRRQPDRPALRDGTNLFRVQQATERTGRRCIQLHDLAAEKATACGQPGLTDLDFPCLAQSRAWTKTIQFSPIHLVAFVLLFSGSPAIVETARSLHLSNKGVGSTVETSVSTPISTQQAKVSKLVIKAIKAQDKLNQIKESEEVSAPSSAAQSLSRTPHLTMILL